MDELSSSPWSLSDLKKNVSSVPSSEVDASKAALLPFVLPSLWGQAERETIELQERYLERDWNRGSDTVFQENNLARLEQEKLLTEEEKKMPMRCVPQRLKASAQVISLASERLRFHQKRFLGAASEPDNRTHSSSNQPLHASRKASDILEDLVMMTINLSTILQSPYL